MTDETTTRPDPGEIVIALGAAVLLVFAVLGLVKDRHPPAPDVAAEDGGGGGDNAVAVAIAGIRYNPPELTVPVGTTVTWTNEDSAAHTVTQSGDSTIEDSGSLAQGDIYEITFDTAGTFEYVCDFHPNMRATVVVEG